MKKVPLATMKLSKFVFLKNTSRSRPRRPRCSHENKMSQQRPSALLSSRISS